MASGMDWARVLQWFEPFLKMHETDELPILCVDICNEWREIYLKQKEHVKQEDIARAFVGQLYTVSASAHHNFRLLLNRLALQGIQNLEMMNRFADEWQSVSDRDSGSDSGSDWM